MAAVLDTRNVVVDENALGGAAEIIILTVAERPQEGAKRDGAERQGDGY